MMNDPHESPLPKESLKAPILFVFRIAIRLGILNNAQYVNYFMNAREDQIARSL